nr:hypothetical protein [Tanacetum cinerariifolium]
GQDTSNRSENDAHADDADIRPIYDEEPTAEVQTTAEINVFAIGQLHTEQPEFNNEREIPTRKIFESSTTKVDIEPPHGSNRDITNLQECIQTLDSSASTSINVQEEHNLDLSAGTPFNLKKERIKTWTKDKVIFGRPRLHGITSLQEISARPLS